MDRLYHVVDAFGASERVASCWSKAGYNSIAFDIRIDSNHDLVSSMGFRTLLQMGLQHLGYMLSMFPTCKTLQNILHAFDCFCNFMFEFMTG